MAKTYISSDPLERELALALVECQRVTWELLQAENEYSLCGLRGDREGRFEASDRMVAKMRELEEAKAVVEEKQQRIRDARRAGMRAVPCAIRRRRFIKSKA